MSAHIVSFVLCINSLLQSVESMLTLEVEVPENMIAQNAQQSKKLGTANTEKGVQEMHTVFEPRHEKTGFLHMRKQRRRSASR